MIQPDPNTPSGERVNIASRVREMRKTQYIAFFLGLIMIINAIHLYIQGHGQANAPVMALTFSSVALLAIVSYIQSRISALTASLNPTDDDENS